MVYVAPAVQGTSHLSYSNNTQVNITRAGCGVTKLCVETPDDCDPTGNNSCLFASVKASAPMAPNGSVLSIQLRGVSPGYVALGLTLNASEGTTMLFVCAQNNTDDEKFFFQTLQRNNTDSMQTPSERTVTEIRGMVNDMVIQCEFDVPSVNATNTRSSRDTTFSVLLGTGNVTGGDIGPIRVSLTSDPLDLSNPASNIPTTATPSTTTGSSGAVQPHAVLLLLSVLILSVMLRA